MFEQSGPTTTSYCEGKVIEPCVKIYKMSDNFVPQPLPKSGPNWSSHKFLSDIIGDEILDSIPIVGIKSGSTDYLDLVRPEEFVDSDGKKLYIMKGMDVFGRHFVTFGIKADCVDADTESKSKFYIYTIFRRYTNLDSIWVLCKSHYSATSGHDVEAMLNCNPTIRDTGIDSLKKLFSAYKDNNKGFEGKCEVYCEKSDDFVEKKFILTFYSPTEKVKENTSK